MEKKTLEAIHKRLVEAAKTRGEFVEYKEIIQLAGLHNLMGDALSGALGNVLFEVNEHDRAQDKDRPMLSAIARAADGHPGNGFYDLARNYEKFDGKDQKSKSAFWNKEVQDLRKYWSPQAAPDIQAIPSSKTYLLNWNPKLSSWTEFQQDWEAVYSGYRPRFEWSCGNTKRIAIGDRVFLMRLGQHEPVTGILLSGYVTREPKLDPHWDDPQREALYVEFEPDVMLNPETDKLLDPTTVSTKFNWHPQSSGISIPPEIALHLEEAWEQHLEGDGINVPASSVVPADQTYIEGAPKLVISYRYERDPRARADCIRHYGTTSQVCGVDLGEVYGSIGEGFIHVHHLTPISEHNTEYMIDAIEDLRPVCPNCHAMLHRKSPPYSIEELQLIRQQAAK